MWTEEHRRIYRREATGIQGDLTMEVCTIFIWLPTIPLLIARKCGPANANAAAPFVSRGTMLEPRRHRRIAGYIASV
jgi:hypothetical protein